MIRKSRLVFAALLSLALLSAPVIAADGVSITEAGGEIVWSTEKTFGSARLSVSGPNSFHVERLFTDGEVPSFYLFGELGEIADGGYTWTLTVTSKVGPGLLAEMEAARAAGDRSFMDRLKAEGRFESNTYTGHFLNRGGVLIVPELSKSTELIGDTDIAASAKAVIPEDLPTKDQVYNTDLIVIASGCIGGDCEDGESFSFDTIRMSENNTRIKFNDTSNSSGNFPSNDWLLTANDSNNGGESYFSIDDVTAGKTPFKVEAGAPNNTLIVDSNGRIGVNTASPVLDVHVVNGDTPTLRLDQDGSDGFTAQIWDVAGNDANFFIRDVTHGSGLPFRIEPDAPNNSVYIDSSGNVGIGKNNPSQTLHIKETDGDGQIYVQETGATGGTTQRVLAHLENNGYVSFQLSNSDSDESWVFTNKDENFEISKVGSGSSELLLDDSGNLTILGSLTASGSRYADYVFRDDYELMDLDTVEAFIEANGHLPNVKSEEEVEYGKRIDMTELSISLLEKVEELTLYTIDQHKTIRELEQRLAALESQAD